MDFCSPLDTRGNAHARFSGCTYFIRYQLGERTRTTPRTLLRRRFFSARANGDATHNKTLMEGPVQERTEVVVAGYPEDRIKLQKSHMEIKPAGWKYKMMTLAHGKRVTKKEQEIIHTQGRVNRRTVRGSLRDNESPHQTIFTLRHPPRNV